MWLMHSQRGQCRRYFGVIGVSRVLNGNDGTFLAWKGWLLVGSGNGTSVV